MRIYCRSKAKAGALLIVLFYFTLSVSGSDWDLLISLKGNWKFSIGDRAEWAHPDFNDREWETIRVPAMWENEGYNGYDGYAWYRKIFNGTALPREKPIYLFLGYIDDVDEVYINGQLVGFSGSFPPKFSTAYQAFRRYLIPNELINYQGNNLVSVRVYDRYGEGGILSGDVGIFTVKGDPKMVMGLQGVWSFRTGDESKWKNRYFNDDDWELITVPRPWESQGYKRYDGYGWYRKIVHFTESQVKEPLVLVLGRIDDFDQTFFNGKLIGATNDGREYGLSNSYRKIRVYDIPPELIRVGQTNTIAIRVLDIGNIGGIYEGPVAIVAKSQLKDFMRIHQ